MKFTPLQVTVMHELEEVGPVNAQEIADWIGEKVNSVRVALRTMERDEITWRSEYQLDAAVWGLTDRGKEKLQELDEERA